MLNRIWESLSAIKWLLKTSRENSKLLAENLRLKHQIEIQDRIIKKLWWELESKNE
ncbi:hypothetical protein [Mycoplasmopsis canis]|uniref:hypothetical protein n=1 Tax=Mycoplasmopsis canis TaxID=29555 RepID=UPI000B2CF934|nr:hypothetical protein [Mycoplasmopsis canis]